MCLGSCQIPNVGKHFRIFDWVWQNHYLDCAPSILDKGDRTTYNDPSPKEATGMITLLWEVVQWHPLSMGTFQCGGWVLTMDMLVAGFLTKRVKINWNNRIQVLKGSNIAFHFVLCNQEQRLEGKLCPSTTVPNPLFCTLWSSPRNFCGLTLIRWGFLWSFLLESERN